MRIRVAAVLLVAGLGAGPLAAQSAAPSAPPASPVDPLSRGYDLERAGNYAAAVEAYRTALARNPGDVSALLGLERALAPLGRGAEAVPAARAALAANDTSSVAHAVEVRAWGAAGQPDSVRRAAERWARVAPGTEAPYREWGNAALQRRDRADARLAFRTGRERLGQPEALAGELAQVAVLDGDYPGSVHDWLLATKRLPGYRVLATTALAATPPAQQAAVLRQLARETDPAARYIEAALQARFGDPVAGYRTLAAALPGDRVRAVGLLRDFQEQLRGIDSPEGNRALGMTLEALAERLPGPQGRPLRLQAARAYADAGARNDAHRMLGQVSDDRESPGVAAGAATTLIGVLIDDGKLDEADRRLAQPGSLGVDDQAALRRRLALAWARQGRLGRADTLLAADSTVDGLAAAGLVALYRGDVPGAVERLRGAGPFAGSRDAATARTALLTILQGMAPDTLPALGQAFLALDGGDTARALTGLDRVAGALPPAAGGAELRLFVGRLAAARGQTADAERQFRAAAGSGAEATAPAAELELGRLLLAAGRKDEAVSTFEHLILTYPRSALVPQARRALDQARGAVPGAAPGA